MSLLGPLHVSGDLAGLVRSYLEEQQDTECDLYRYLDAFAPNSRITFNAWWALLEDLQQRYPQRAIGVELGERVQADYVGVLGYMLLASKTLLEALQGFQRFQRLLHDGDKAQAVMEDGLLCLRWSNDFGDSSSLSDEVLVIGMLSFMRRMTGKQALVPVRVDFRFVAPSSRAEHERVCGCPLRFNQLYTAIYLSLADLQLSVSQHDESLRQLLEQQAQTLLDVLPHRDHFVQRLRSALLLALQTGQADSGFVAKHLHLSERTLFRRLSEQGLTFKAVLAQVRTQLAQQYLLEGRLTLTEIALLLGYSEQSAFCRAFKQQTGLPPARWLLLRRS